jgi:hypothetical protein
MKVMLWMATVAAVIFWQGLLPCCGWGVSTRSTAAGPVPLDLEVLLGWRNW